MIPRWPPDRIPPWPLFIDPGRAPGAMAYAICHASGDVEWGEIPADHSQDEALADDWEHLRKWELAVWIAVWDGNDGSPCCGTYLDHEGEPVLLLFKDEESA